MILQALYELAGRERLIEDPDFEWKPIAWLIAVRRDGELLGIHGTHTILEVDEGKGKKKPKPRPKSFPVPREPGRTSGDRAFFLYDKAEYILGLDPEPDLAKRRPADKLAARFALFRERADECLAATGDEGIRAVCRFLARLAAGEISVTLPEGCASNDLFAFLDPLEGEGLVTSRPLVREYWMRLRAQAEAPDLERQICLVSGAPAVPVDKLPLIKNVPGGSTSGIALVSFNSNAFESYGWKGNENALISRDAAEACATALNRLLHPAFPDPKNQGQTLPQQHLRLSADTAVCFWTSQETGEDFASQLAALFEANPDHVRDLYRSVWRGVPVAVDDPSAFYALTLSGSQGRAILRDWLEETVGRVAGNLALHFADLALVRNAVLKDREPSPALPLRVLVRSLAVRGDDANVPAALAGEIVHAALSGTPYPLGLLQRALERTRAEIGRDDWSDRERRDARAALIKAVLVRRRRTRQANTSYPEISEAMDPNNMNPGYRLGRLLAILERMQQTALGDVSASVVDRFFGSASATPAAVFPRLLKNFRHHARKAQDSEKPEDRRRAGFLERDADEILAGIQTFPSFLSLEEQGLFVLGYHHQRHDFFQTREERERRRSEQARQTEA